MKNYDSPSMQLNLNNSYLRLFQLAQQNWQLWQQEEQIKKQKKHRTK